MDSKFMHSIKVPTQYKKAASIFKKNITEKKSVKSLIYEEQHAKIPNLLVLFHKYCANKHIIENLIEKTGIIADNPRFDIFLCRVLITELLFGVGNLKGQSKPVLCVLQYKQKLIEELKNSAETVSQNTVTKPRYVRVNTNLFSVADFIKELDQEEWQKTTEICETYEKYLKTIESLNEYEYAIDMHIDSLFVFSSKWKSYWASHQLTVEKKIILQDKATCLVSELLDPRPNSIVLDMCAAPGIKTIHMSNKMNNQGTIYAIEQCPKRFQTLNEMLEKSGSKITKTINADALTITREDVPDVEYILVDPSCSGSGMQGRISLNTDEKKDPDRLLKLSCLQGKLLCHAMTEFPKAKRVVYSTCSVYPEENEGVVEWCLKKCPNFKLLTGKKSLRGQWKNVGSTDYKGVGKKCIYSYPNDDHTDGIFIAIFERISDNS